MALKDFISKVIPGIDFFMSEQDISKGSKGLNEISEKLENSFFGIVCLTEDNLNSPWINFEAGALSKHISTDRVSPFLVNVEISDLGPSPLSQFQATFPNKSDLKGLVEGIAKQSGISHANKNLSTYFDTFWPDFEAVINSISHAKKQGTKDSESTELESQLSEFVRQLNNINYKLNSPDNLFSDKTIRRIALAATSPEFGMSTVMNENELLKSEVSVLKTKEMAYAKLISEIYDLVDTLKDRVGEDDVSFDLQLELDSELAVIVTSMESFWESDDPSADQLPLLGLENDD